MLEWRDGKIIPIDGVDELDNPLRKLKRSDRHTEKYFYNRCLLYAYFMYKKGGMYENMYPKERAKEVSLKYFNDINAWKKFESNAAFKGFKTYYEAIQYDAEERALIALEAEIEDLILHLKDIKYYIEDKVDVFVDVPAFEGSEDLVKKKIKRVIKISNYKEKKEALLAIADVIKIRKLLKEEVKTKSLEKKNNASKSLMDRNEL